MAAQQRLECVDTEEVTITDSAKANRLAAAAGILAYLAGLAVVGRPLAAETPTRPPTPYATR